MAREFDNRVVPQEAEIRVLVASETLEPMAQHLLKFFLPNQEVTLQNPVLPPVSPLWLRKNLSKLIRVSIMFSIVQAQIVSLYLLIVNSRRERVEE